MDDMTIVEQVSKDMVAAMKAQMADKLSTLRLMKTAFKMKEIEKRAQLTDAEAQAAIQTMIKQRRESIEMFTKGNRPELAAHEQAEIGTLEAYLPKEAPEGEVRLFVENVLAAMTVANGGTRPGQRDMGLVMKAVQAKIAEGGLRADGKVVSSMVKEELAK
jgi:uncharacterized protein YqeY